MLLSWFRKDNCKWKTYNVCDHPNFELVCTLCQRFSDLDGQKWCSAGSLERVRLSAIGIAQRPDQRSWKAYFTTEFLGWVQMMVTFLFYEAYPRLIEQRNSKSSENSSTHSSLKTTSMDSLARRIETFCFLFFDIWRELSLPQNFLKLIEFEKNVSKT